MAARLAVAHVSWQVHGATIVEDVSFEAQPGELIALLGRNGAGKSTLLDLIASLRQPSSGRILVDGQPLQALTAAARARRIGHLPQLTRDALPFSVEQMVAMGRYPHTDRWFESGVDRQAIDIALARSGCRELRHRRLSTLSGGERQRVLLAACLAQQPDILLLDEPSTFLDVEQQLHCFSILRDEAAAGRLCLAVTHDLNLALTFATRLIVMGERTIVSDLPVAAALSDSSWLSRFSPRLSMHVGAGGRSWVSYR